MKLLMFREADGRRLGVLLDGAVDRVVDVAELAKAAGTPQPAPDILALVQQGPSGLERLRRLLAELDRSVSEPTTTAGNSMISCGSGLAGSSQVASKSRAM